MGGSCESQTTGWLHTLVGFSSETSPDTHREIHESRENTSPLSWWWREMKPPRTRLSLFSRNRGFVCRKKSHEAVGWGHWWKSHWWRRRKRKTKLHSWRWEKSVEGPPWTPAEQGDPNGVEGKFPSKSALNCAQTPPASKSWTSGCAHAQQLKKKKKASVCPVQHTHLTAKLYEVWRMPRKYSVWRYRTVLGLSALVSNIKCGI